MKEKYISASKKLSELDFNLSYDGISVKVYWFRVMQMKPGDIVFRHTHSSCEFHIVKEGSCTVVTDDGEYEMSAGMTYITPPGVFHEQICGADGYAEYCLNCGIDRADGGGTEAERVVCFYRDIPFTVIKDTKRMENLFELALNEADEMCVGYYSGISHIIFLIVTLTAAHQLGSEEGEHSGHKKPSYDFVRFERIKRYIDDNICTGVRVSDIAQLMFLSEKQISRIIKHCCGYSAKEYILSRRHEKAKEFLKYTDKSISEIAEQLGFSSVQYFVCAFERREGETPLKFRKSVRKV